MGTGEIVTGAILVVLVALGFFLFSLIKRSLAGKSGWAISSALAGMVAGVVGTGALVCFFWRPAVNQINNWIGPARAANPMVVGGTIALLIVAAVWIACTAIKKFLEYVFGGPNIGQGVANLLAMGGTIYTLLYFTGVAAHHGGAWLWTVRLMTVITFIAIGRWATNRWFKEKAQDRWGVFVTYTICNVLTAYIMLSVGWSIFANIVGSIYSLSFFLAFNLCLFWLSYGLGDPDKPLHKRLGFYFNCAWMIGLLLVSGLFVILQASGKLTWFEQETARQATETNQQLEELERELATDGLTQLKEEFAGIVEAARNEPDKKIRALWLKEARKYREKIAQFPVAQRGVGRSSIVKTEAVEEVIQLAASLLPKPYFKQFELKERGETKVTEIFTKKMMLKISVSESPMTVSWPKTNVSVTLPVGEHPFKVEGGDFITFVGTGKFSRAVLTPWS